MIIVQINSCNFAGTGNVVVDIAKSAREANHDAYICVSNSRSNLPKRDENTILINGKISRILHFKLAYYTGKHGCYSRLATKKLLKRLDEIKPDILHLHNLHNCYINLKMLFSYIKEHNVKVVWTLHDCWPLTGHCTHFAMVKCDKWKTHCHDCPQHREYPYSRFDKTQRMYSLKKEWFTDVKDLTIVTPSKWLADVVKQSFLKDYPVKVINNGIDLEMFKPTESDFREKYGLENKKIVLGLAFSWGKPKGFDVFVELSKRLPENYQIVLVGTNERLDEQLPKNIISIHCTHNKQELAKFYSLADVFVNPTRQDTYPTVNIESLACGTPVITFNAGGSPEIIDGNTGSVVEVDDIDAMEKEIIRVCESYPYSFDNCVERSKFFDRKDKFKEYITLYEAIHEEKKKHLD